MMWRLPRAPRFPRLVLLCSISLAAALPLAPAQDIFVTPVANAPFTAVVQVERSSVRPDGSLQAAKTLRQIARDSRGRIYNEARTLIPVSSKETPQVRSIHLYDPETRISTMLDTERQTFWTMTVRRPPATVPPALLEATPAGETPRAQRVRQEGRSGDRGNRRDSGTRNSRGADGPRPRQRQAGRGDR